MTILIVAISLMAILAMSALAIDIVALYVSEGDAQRAADAAALAGAKTFVSSGFTSWQLGDPASGVAQSLVCNGSTGPADLAARGLVTSPNNLIAGVAATTVTTSCTFTNPGNPQIMVSVERTGLPSFFARIWGGGSALVRRTATAEAYNPSGQSVPVQVHSVKPWLIPNGGFYFDTTTYNIKSANAFVGQTTPTTFSRNPNLTSPPPPPTLTSVQYYPLNIPIDPPTPSCPATTAPSCSNLFTGGPHANYRENIGCSNRLYLMTSTDQIGSASPNPTPPMTLITNTGGIDNVTQDGVDCLIHADAAGSAKSGQDTINPSVVGTPVTIAGGYNNPNPTFTTATRISRSDSVVTVPVYNDTGAAPCAGSPPVCNQLQIIGFLQLGIQFVDATGAIHAVILNAAGSNPGNIGTSPILGGGVSPIPVRLIQ